MQANCSKRRIKEGDKCPYAMKRNEDYESGLCVSWGLFVARLVALVIFLIAIVFEEEKLMYAIMAIVFVMATSKFILENDKDLFNRCWEKIEVPFVDVKNSISIELSWNTKTHRAKMQICDLESGEHFCTQLYPVWIPTKDEVSQYVENYLNSRR